jgi:hypothetical protein
MYERGKRDAPGAQFIQRVEQDFLDPTIEQGVEPPEKEQQ